MNENDRIAAFAAELIRQGRNPIIAVIEATQALKPNPQRKGWIVHSVGVDGTARGKER